MRYFILLLILGLLARKGYLAWRRGRNAYVRDREQYATLWEYLVANGASEREACRPFLERAVRRAVEPLLHQWRFWAVIAALIVLYGLAGCE